MFPDRYVERITDLSPGELKSEGLEGLLLDIDGTLKDYGAEDFPIDTLDWIARVREEQIGICLFSNGVLKKVQAAASRLGAPYVAKAYKPLPFRCAQGLSKLGLPASRVALVGDQIFTDVLAGRLAGMRTILVDPTSRIEPWFTRLKRPLELPLRRRLRKSLGVRPALIDRYAKSFGKIDAENS